MSNVVCVPKSLTDEQLQLAVRRSIEINPANADSFQMVERNSGARRGGTRRLALLKKYRWPDTGVDLSVSFIDDPSKELRKRILLHMNAWSKTANIRFRETRDTGQVRIARNDEPPSMSGYWSYVGTQILAIDDDEPTMNLEGFTMRTAESEFKRVVRHEAGHTLGFDHEHMRKELIEKIDRPKCLAYFKRTQGWSAKETTEQVLTPLSARSIMGTTEADPLSIMCYEIPAAITKNRKAIRGGNDINPKDYDFAATIYPKTKAKSPVKRTADSAGGDGEPVSRTPSFAPQISALFGAASASDDDADTFQIVVMDGFNEQSGGSASTATAQSDEERPKFARVFASYGGAMVTRSMRLRADRKDEPTMFGEIIRTHQRIKHYTDRASGTLPSDEDLIEFGGRLFDTLFEGDVRRLYDEARARQRNRKLDLIFTSMIPWIADKPWEFCFDTTRKSFVATEEIHLLRNVLTAVPAYVTRPQAGPLRILVVSSQPRGTVPLSIEQEKAVIERGFLPLVDAKLVEIEPLVNPTPRTVLEYLSTGSFTVVHFIGHGAFDESQESGTLLFENERGEPIALNERSVREIFGKRGINLVFLNACQTGTGGRHNFNKGLAQSLVAHGLPAAVANQYSVLDTSATSFAQHFYWALAHGMSVGRAACEARIAVNCSMRGDLIDWAVPVVYARDPNMTLRIRPDTVRSLPTAVPGTRRGLAQSRAVRIAVWDTDNVFPELAETLLKMNLAQDTFGFDLVALSAPIDAWYLGQRAEDGTPYLWAEKLALRLGQKPAELGVDILVCVTRHWLCDNDTLNLYGWWPDEEDRKKTPVTIVSCAGFDDLAPAGRDTERAIANLTVAMLAGMLGGLGSHEKGSKACPLYYNEERSLNGLINRQEFDKSCAKKLKGKLPKELPALEALLRLFDEP